eukprot:2908104-Rhodomonas_salina.1
MRPPQCSSQEKTEKTEGAVQRSGSVQCSVPFSSVVQCSTSVLIVLFSVGLQCRADDYDGKEAERRPVTTRRWRRHGCAAEYGRAASVVAVRIVTQSLPPRSGGGWFTIVQVDAGRAARQRRRCALGGKVRLQV